MNIVNGVRSVLLSTLVGTASQALASDLNFQFIVNWQQGQLAGTQSLGQFSFDSALVSPEGTVVTTNVLTGFDFTIRGIHFGPEDVTAPVVTFTAAGDLASILFGTECYVTGPIPWGNCVAKPDHIDSFFVSASSTPGELGAAVGDGPLNALDATLSWGAVIVTPMGVVPEPPIFALIASGIVVVGLRALRRSAA